VSEERSERDRHERRQREDERRHVRHRPALQRRHLPERPEQARAAHQHEPAEQPEPDAACVVVRRELRREAVQRIRNARAGGDEEARVARGTAQAERQKSEDGEDGERDPEASALRVRGVSGGRRQREERHSARDRERGERLAPADVLVELPHRDEEEEDERRREQRLDERERRLRQRIGLAEPAEDAERRAGDPARAANEAQEEGEAERVVRGLLTGLERLQSHPEREQRRGAERGEDADQERRHDRQRP
jgi:hypothetical protein